MNDPRNVVHEHPDKRVLKAMQEQQKKDLAEGNCVKSPGPGWVLADKPMRVKCIAFAKRLNTNGLWVGKIESKVYDLKLVDATGAEIVDDKGKPINEKIQGWDAQVTFGHWWIKGATV